MGQDVCINSQLKTSNLFFFSKLTSLRFLRRRLSKIILIYGTDNYTNATVSVFIETLVVVLHKASYESRLILESLDTALCKSPGFPFGSDQISQIKSIFQFLFALRFGTQLFFQSSEMISKGFRSTYPRSPKRR